MQAIIIIVVIAACIAYAMWMGKFGTATVSNMGPAMREFFERSGYRHSQIPQAPIEQQIQQSMVLAEQQRKGNSDIHMVRLFDEQPIHWHCWTRVGGRGFTMGCEWNLQLAQPLRGLFHVAEKSLGSTAAAVKGFMTSSERTWSPAYPHRVETGDAELDGRFQIYCNDPSAARILTTPEIKSLLLAQAEVDLVVKPNEVQFFDPSQNNLRSAMGGTAGMMKAARDPSKSLMMSLPVHDAISRLLVTAARCAA